MNDLSKPVQSRLIAFLFAFGLTLYITVSSALMSLIGIPYTEPIGNPIFKINLATYLLLGVFVLAHLMRGNPIRSVAYEFSRHKPIAAYFLVTVMLIIYSILRYGPAGAAFIVDTLMMPAICAMLMLMFDLRFQKRILFLIIALLVVNSIIAIGEALVETNLIPYTVAGKVTLELYMFRSTGLLGHPLKNALITGTVMMLVLTLRIGTLSRILLLGVMFLSLIGYGGRTSFVLVILMLMVYGISVASSNLVHGRYHYLRIMSGIVGAFFALAVIIGVTVAAGIGERLFETLTKWDNSASVRVNNWAALDFMSTADVLFGMSPTAIENIVYRLSLVYELGVIENFWLGLLMQLGVVGLVPFIFALGYILWYFWRNSQAPGRMAIVFFFLAASTNNALSTKNIALIVLFVGLIGAAAYARMPRTAVQASPLRRPPPRAFRSPNRAQLPA